MLKIYPQKFTLIKYLDNLMKKILYIVTVEWFFLSHRLSLAQQAKNG